MSIHFGPLDINQISVGALPVSKIYLGTGNAIWEGDSSLDYLKFTAETAGAQIWMHINGNLNPLPVLEYSNDGITWNDFIISTTETTGTYITLAKIGDYVYFRGNNTTFSTSTTDYVQFSTLNNVYVSGNIMSLLDKTGAQLSVPDYAFYNLFNSTNIITPPRLPATTIGQYSYAQMFAYCTKLVTCPEINHITSIAFLSCLSMFVGCTSLTHPMTSLPSITNYNSYQAMFMSCSNLISAPKLPAIEIYGGSYAWMFSQCIKLTRVPDLPMEQFINGPPAQGMFYNCSSLYVSDTYGADYRYIWAIPEFFNGSGYDGENPDMFTNCLGTRSTDSPNFYNYRQYYYTQNDPI